MARAREAGLDLVEVDSNGKPPVCRILDYGKFKYEQSKRERDARKHQRGTMIHEVRLRPRTGQHDIDLKVRIATRLLATGDKVKLSVMFRGREISHPEVGREVLNKAMAGLGDTVTIEKPPGMEGRFLTVILSPTAKKPAAKDGAKARPGNGAGGGSKRAVKAEKAAEAKAAAVAEDKKALVKAAEAVEAKTETKAAPAAEDKKAPAKAAEAVEAKTETKAAPAAEDKKATATATAAEAVEAKAETKPAPAADGDASAAKKAEAAASAKKDEA
jgi:translation initiation factor IF-3